MKQDVFVKHLAAFRSTQYEVGIIVVVIRKVVVRFGKKAWERGPSVAQLGKWQQHQPKP